MQTMNRTTHYGWLIILLCATTLAGWHFNIASFISIIPNAPVTTPLTVILLLLSSVALLSIAQSKKKTPYTRTNRLISRILILSGAALTLWIGAKYLFDLSPDVELMLYKDKILQYQKDFPGRPSMRTIFVCLVSFITLWIASSNYKHSITLLHTLVILIIITPWIALFGYAGSSGSLYSISPSSGTGMSPVTAVGFILLSIGLLTLEPSDGIFGVLKKKSSGAALARSLLPVALLGPLLLSWFVRFSLRAEWMSTSYSISLSFGLLSLLITTLVLSSSVMINRKDAAVNILVQKLKESEERHHQLVNEVQDYAIIRLDREGKIEVWNKGAERITQFKESEILNKPFSLFFTDDDIQDGLPKKLLETAIRHEKVKTEGWRKRKSGELYWANAVITALYDAQHQVIGFAKITQDRTQQRKAMEDLATSEKRFRRLLESTPDAMVITNEQGIVTFANTLCENVFGFEKNEIEGKPVELLIPEKFTGDHAKHRTTYIAHPTVRMMGEGLELSAKRKDGTEFPVEVSLSPINTDNHAIEIAASIRNITERKLREEESKRYLANLELLQHIGSMGYYEVDIQHQTCKISKTYRQLFGFKKQEVTLAELQSHVHPEDRDRIVAEFERATETNTQFQAEYRVIHPDTSIVLFVRNNCYFISDTHGTITAIGLKQDITPFKQAERKIHNLNGELLRSNKELEAFSYSVSHDLRAPLRAITGFTNKLVDKRGHLLDDEGKRIANIIVSNAHKMGQLIDDILAFSKLTRENISLTRVNIEQLFRDVFQLQFALESDRKIDFEVEPLPEIMCDQAMMRQVVTNLISNALKYTRPKEVAVIQVGLSNGRADKVIYVRDNGVGFDMRHKDKLFGVFQRLHGDGEFEGTGVGLAIAQRVLDKHKGKIWGEGKPGEGATFYFTYDS